MKEVKDIVSFSELITLMTRVTQIQKLLQDLYYNLTGSRTYLFQSDDDRIYLRNDKLTGFANIVFTGDTGNLNRIAALQFSDFDDLDSIEALINNDFEYKSTVDQTSRDNIYTTFYSPKSTVAGMILMTVSRHEIFRLGVSDIKNSDLESISVIIT